MGEKQLTVRKNSAIISAVKRKSADHYTAGTAVFRYKEKFFRRYKT